MTPVYILLAISICLLLTTTIILMLLLKKSKSANSQFSAVEFEQKISVENSVLKEEINKQIRNENSVLKKDVLDTLNAINNMNSTNISAHLDRQNSMIQKSLQILAEEEEKNSTLIESKFNEFLKSTEEKLNFIRQENSKSLAEVRADNEKQLDKMRATVDEKLSTTLENRFNNSFKLVTDQLDTINRSFAEMRTLQTNVTDLKKIFTNVKQRGTWGEVSLEALLSQILTSEQYGKSVNIAKNNRVDFAIIMPGKNDETVLLPLDAKFPVEDYQRIIEGSEIGDADAVEIAGKALEKRIKNEAMSIRDKYISPPKTTDFAIMYLPSESMFSEVIKRPGLIEELQNQYRIVVCGPTTLAALLNSLQMGFRTVAIQKRSTEIWKMLETFKKDFNTFSDLLGKTKKKLDEVTQTIEKAGDRTRIIQKRLGKVESMPNESMTFDSKNLLGETAAATDNDDSTEDDNDNDLN